jgi:hypothetical protein
MRKIFFALSLLIGSVVASNSYAAIQLTLFAPTDATALITDWDGIGAAVDDIDPVVGSIVVVSKTVGAYTFAVNATQSSTTGLLTIQNSSVLTITGATAGKVGILASTSGAPTSATIQTLIQSNADVSYASGSNRSTAAVSYASYVDTTNVLSTVTHSGGVVTAVPGGTLVDSGSGSIDSPIANPNSGWVASGNSVQNYGGSPVAMNLLVLADFSTAATGSGAVVHKIQLNGSMQLSPVPEPTSMTVWALSGLLGLVVRRRWS